MLGAIIGDIVGSRFEFHPNEEADFELITERCHVTDDTVMTIAIADAILAAGSARPHYLEPVLKWGRRYPHMSYGGRFGPWLRSRDPKPYNSFGNGSAMRVSAVGWAYDSVDDVLLEAERSAAISHNHPEGIKGAQATALGVYMLRNGASRPEVKSEITQRFGYDLDRSLDAIRPTYTFDETCQGTVPEAIVSFLESSSYEEAVRNAVLLRGDADTLACIAGALAEAAYGIPLVIADRARPLIPADMRGVLDRFVAGFSIDTVRG